MKRSDAIALLVQRHRAAHITRSSVHFANINATKDVWWLDIPLTKVAQQTNPTFHLLLYHHGSGVLYHLEIPKTYVREQEHRLVIRQDQGCISLELSAEQERMFRDVRPKGGGVEFSQFLKDSIV